MLPVAFLALALSAPAPKSKPVQIDLSEAYSTVEMKGLKKARAANPKDLDNELEIVRKAALRAGSSNLFLVRGGNFDEALKATRVVYGSGWGGKGEPAVARGAKQTGELWVVAFLGNTYSDPAAFDIKRIEMDGLTVRVVFSRPHPGGRSQDFTPYIIWANLGNLESGSYRLELIDADQKDEIVMFRRVAVNKEKE